MRVGFSLFFLSFPFFTGSFGAVAAVRTTRHVRVNRERDTAVVDTFVLAKGGKRFKKHIGLADFRPAL